MSGLGRVGPPAPPGARTAPPPPPPSSQPAAGLRVAELRAALAAGGAHAARPAQGSAAASRPPGEPPSFAEFSTHRQPAAPPPPLLPAAAAPAPAPAPAPAVPKAASAPPEADPPPPSFSQFVAQHDLPKPGPDRRVLGVAQRFEQSAPQPPAPPQPQPQSQPRPPPPPIPRASTGPAPAADDPPPPSFDQFRAHSLVTEVADDEDDGEDEPAATFRTSIDLYNFSHQRQLPPSAQRCSQTACWNAAEIQGMCLQHYYDYCKSFTAGSGIPTPRRASIAAAAAAAAELQVMVDDTMLPCVYDENGNPIVADPATEEKLAGKPLFQAVTARSSFAAEPKYDFSELKSSSAAVGPGEQQARRAKLIEEFFTTEKTYLRGIRTAHKAFQQRLKVLNELKRPVLDASAINDVFLNLEEVVDLHEKIYADLKPLRKAGRLVSPDFARTLLKYLPFLRLYNAYVLHYDEATRKIAKLKAENRAFAQLLEENEKLEGLTLESFLIMPVQRLPRYLLLLKGVLDTCKPAEPLHAEVARALEMVTQVTNHINDSFRMRESRNRVVAIQGQLENAFPLVTPTRYYVRDGPLRKKFMNSWHMNKDKRYWFFLFNDLLIYTTPPSSVSGNCKLKHHLNLIDMVVRDLPDTAEQRFAFEIQGKPKSFVVYAASEQEKQDWMLDLQKCINATRYNASTFLRR